MTKLKYGLVLISIAVLGACGGGGGSVTASGSTTITLSGIAATGAAIQAGSVSVKCSTGTGSTTTNNDGSFTVNVENGTFPCILKATDINTNSDYYSVAESGATKANITPLTHLVAANALGDAPSAAFVNFNAVVQKKINGASLDSAQTHIKAATASLGSDTDMTGVDLLKSSFSAATPSAVGDETDKKLDALMSALAAANKRISDLEQQLKTVTSAESASSKITTEIGSAKDKLDNCDYARSSTLWSFGMGGTLQQFKVDYKKMQATRIADNTVSALNLKTDENGKVIKCAFTTTIDNQLVQYRIAPGGNILWSQVDGFGLGIPAQTTWNLSDKEAAGTYPTLVFLSQKNNRSIRAAFPMKLVIKQDGTVDSYICDLTKEIPDCSNAASDSPDKATCSKLENGSFSCSTTAGNKFTGALYVNGSQVSLYLAITDLFSNGVTWSGVSVSTKAAVLELPKVGDKAPTGWYVSIGSGSFAIKTGTTTSNAAVKSIDRTTNSFITSDTTEFGGCAIGAGDADKPICTTTIVSEDTKRFINSPAAGMLYSTPANFKSITLNSNGGWSLGINKSNAGTLWDGWVATIRTP